MVEFRDKSSLFIIFNFSVSDIFACLISKIVTLSTNSPADISANIIRNEIKSSLKLYEPRVNVREVEVKPNFDQNEFNVTIIYEIIGADVPAQELQFVLESTR